MSLKTSLGNLALLGGSVLVCLAVVEVAARIDYHTRGGGKEQQEALEYITPDEYLGWRKRAGARVRYDRREYSVEVAINSLGMRDPERSPDPRGAWRILALGDSFIEGYSVPLEDTVTQQLERRLGRPHCAIEVLNGGTAAWATDQEYLYYAREAHRYGARVVLLFLYYNDIWSNTRSDYFGARKPLLEMQDGELVLTNYPVRPRRERPQREVPEREPISGSAAWLWVKERIEVGAPQLYDRLAGWGLWNPLRQAEPHVQERVYKDRRDPGVEEAWQRTDDIVRALRHEVEAQGARLALVYVPSRREVSDRDWELTRIRYGLDEKWDRGLVARRVGEVAASAGVPLLDLTPALRSASGTLGEPYFIFDGHWNSRGHEAAAQAVEGFLREAGWLPACAG